MSASAETLMLRHPVFGAIFYSSSFPCRICASPNAQPVGGLGIGAMRQILIDSVEFLYVSQ